MLRCNLRLMLQSLHCINQCTLNFIFLYVCTNLPRCTKKSFRMRDGIMSCRHNTQDMTCKSNTFWRRRHTTRATNVMKHCLTALRSHLNLTWAEIATDVDDDDEDDEHDVFHYPHRWNVPKPHAFQDPHWWNVWKPMVHDKRNDLAIAAAPAYAAPRRSTVCTCVTVRCASVVLVFLCRISMQHSIGWRRGIKPEKFLDRNQ